MAPYERQGRAEGGEEQRVSGRDGAEEMGGETRGGGRGGQLGGVGAG